MILKADALEATIESVGHLVAAVLSELPSATQEKISRELESGDASVLIRLTPATASVTGELQTTGGIVDLFTAGPLSL